jgi:L-ascorbate metabolism protein UlaG (beta-lactamase superfamily)
MDALQRRAGLRLERTRASAQFADGSFRNPSGLGPELQGSSLPVMGEYFFGKGVRKPPGPLPMDRPHERWAARPDTGFRATWLGHSTVLLEMDGRRVLTDPVFAERISPVSFAGPKRFHPVPARLEELPPLDVVLLSHDHYDHLCRATMQSLARMRVPIVTALGVGEHLESFGVEPERITELDWQESTEVGGIRFTATPAQHFSGRGPFSRNRTLWASWVVESQRRKVFFSGDTGLTTAFEGIGRAHGPFGNALEAFSMLGGGTLLPVHWGTFNLALHDWDEPAETLLVRAAQQSKRIVTPRLGAPIEPEHVEGPVPWWRGVSVRRLP